MEKIVLRRIIYLKNPIPDPQGAPGKPTRAYSIVRVDAPITDSSLIHIVAITSEMPIKHDPNFVALKYGPNNPSGLKIKCAAHCGWSADTPISNIRDFGRLIDADELNRILLRLKELKRG